MKKLLILCVVFCLISACDQGADEQFNAEAVQQEVGARVDAFYQALERKDSDALLDFYSQEASFYWVEDGRMAYPDHASMAGSLNGLFGSLEKVENQELGRKIITQGRGRVQVFLEYKQQFTMKGGYGFGIEGALTASMVKEDETWRFLFGHSSVKKER